MDDKRLPLLRPYQSELDWEIELEFSRQAEDEEHKQSFGSVPDDTPGEVGARKRGGNRAAYWPKWIEHDGSGPQ